MRTTVRVDDDVIEELRARARRENISLNRLINRTLRAGLRIRTDRGRSRPRYRERVQSMGVPRLALDKALALAATIEDEEVVRELSVHR